MRRKSPSLAGRAVLAVVLMVGFYVLAVGIALGLLYLPYAEAVYAGRLHLRLGLACLAGAAAILWSVIPRPDDFEPPGPQLDPTRQPRLFKELAAVADAVGQKMPAHVYLVPDVNAWVSSRGGVMGFGSSRVMGLGLPLLQVLSVAELRAVLAHEFGHYHGGDTALAPWVYKTRVAIGRTLENLKEGILHLPFLWYGKMFLRVSHAVSRQQEYAADALAARVVGASPLISGLKSVHRAGAAFQPYWRGELAPVLSAGFRPPVAAGFAAFMNAEPISQETATSLAREMDSPTESPYDTHPALKDRIAALGGEGDLQPDTAGIPALSLLDDVDTLERELLTLMFPAEGGRTFEHVGWSDTLTAIYLPAWRSTVEPHLESLSGIHLGDLPDLVQDPSQLVARFSKALGASMPENQKLKTVAGILGVALTIALHSRGVPITCDVGYPIQARLGSAVVNTFSIVGELASSELARISWKALMAENGLASLDLGATTPTHPKG